MTARKELYEFEGGMMQRYREGPDHSMERAMIGRRASETEVDLLRLLAPRGS